MKNNHFKDLYPSICKMFLFTKYVNKDVDCQTDSTNNVDAYLQKIISNRDIIIPKYVFENALRDESLEVLKSLYKINYNSLIFDDYYRSTIELGPSTNICSCTDCEDDRCSYSSDSDEESNNDKNNNGNNNNNNNNGIISTHFGIIAIKRGDLEILKWVVDTAQKSGMSYNTIFGESDPLYLAIQKQNIDIIRFIHNEVNEKPYKIDWIHYSRAVCYNNLELFKELYKLDNNKEEGNIMHVYQECIKGCKYDFIEYIDSISNEGKFSGYVVSEAFSAKNESALDWIVQNQYRCGDPLFGKSIRTFGSKDKILFYFNTIDTFGLSTVSILNIICYQSDLISINELDEQLSKVSKDKFVIDLDRHKWHLENLFKKGNLEVLEFVYKYFPSLFTDADLEYATKHCRNPNGLIWIIDNNIVSNKKIFIKYLLESHIIRCYELRKFRQRSS